MSEPGENIVVRWASACEADGVIIEWLPEGISVPVSIRQLPTTLAWVGWQVRTGRWMSGMKMDACQLDRMKALHAGLISKLAQLHAGETLDGGC